MNIDEQLPAIKSKVIKSLARRGYKEKDQVESTILRRTIRAVLTDFEISFALTKSIEQELKSYFKIKIVREPNEYVRIDSL